MQKKIRIISYQKVKELRKMNISYKTVLSIINSQDCNKLKLIEINGSWHVGLKHGRQREVTSAEKSI